MGRIIVVSSGKGGVGKTTITANLGIMLAKLNKSVCLVDGDFGLNNLDIALGLENRVVYDIVDILQGKCRLVQGLVKDPILSNLYLLPSCRAEAKKFVNKEDFKGLILDLERVFDYVLIDCPAGVDYGYERAITPAKEMLVIVTPNISAIRDASRAILNAKCQKEMDIKLVVNRIVDGLVKSGEMLSYKDIENLLGEPVVGLVYENMAVCTGNSLKTIFETEPNWTNSFKMLARNIDNNICDIKEFNPRQNNILSNLKNRFRRVG